MHTDVFYTGKSISIDREPFSSLFILFMQAHGYKTVARFHKYARPSNSIMSERQRSSSGTSIRKRISLKYSSTVSVPHKCSFNKTWDSRANFHAPILFSQLREKRQAGSNRSLCISLHVERHIAIAMLHRRREYIRELDKKNRTTMTRAGARQTMDHSGAFSADILKTWSNHDTPCQCM